jgi:malonate-semialdehyde dehydrogenase (acetylating) / methylmalonate-semialdehyde dehydrogenase
MSQPNRLGPFPGRSYDFVAYTNADNWIGGALRPAVSGESLEVQNPRHGKAMGRVAMSDRRDVDLAVAAAKPAQKAWAAVPLKERAQVMFRFKELLEKNLDELAWLVSHENGKTFAESKASVMKGVECVEFGCSLENMAQGAQMDVSRGVNCEVRYEPVGIGAGVTPFNFPVMVSLWMLPQALVAGNAFILKPSEVVPYGSIRLAQLLKEAGLPDGVLSVVNGGQAAVEALCDHPDIKSMAFVGSTKVAKLVYARGAQAGKSMLCLGGAKNHLVVVPDADVELSAENIVASSFGCAGQRCMAASVLMAVGDVQKVIDRVVAHAQKITLGESMGPVISAAARERIVNAITTAEKMGAKVLLDGRGAKVPGADGYWVGPTVLDQVTADMPAGCDEIFGPVLSIRRVRTLDEAIQAENQSPYGNAASIYTTSGAVAQYAIDRFEAGMCAVNIGVPVPREPFSFGGWNQSKFGHGDITGYDGFRFWTRPRKVTSKWALQSDTNWMS